MTIQMTRDEFWTIVESVGWEALVAEEKACEGRPEVGERATDKGKAILLSLLPTREHMRAFDLHMMEVSGDISRAIYDYNDTLDEPEWIGGDSGGDLIAHIVGCGRTEYDRVTADPRLAIDRYRKGDYFESFSYCTPSFNDYDPTEVKLARELSGLVYWQKHLEAEPEYSLAQSEVEWRSKAVAKLQAQLTEEGGSVMTPEEAESILREKQRREDAKWEALRNFDRETDRLRDGCVERFNELRREQRQALLATFQD